jgi:hypothetical protein
MPLSVRGLCGADLGLRWDSNVPKKNYQMICNLEILVALTGIYSYPEMISSSGGLASKLH